MSWYLLGRKKQLPQATAALEGKIVSSKGRRSFHIDEVDFKLEPGFDQRDDYHYVRNEAGDVVYVTLRFHFKNNPPVDGRKFVEGILRGLESIE